jgi:hypothetical protein
MAPQHLLMDRFSLSLSLPLFFTPTEQIKTTACMPQSHMYMGDNIHSEKKDRKNANKKMKSMYVWRYVTKW